MFSRWLEINITSARGTLHCRKILFLAGKTRDLWTVDSPHAFAYCALGQRRVCFDNINLFIGFYLQRCQ
jgi:hypothetical protein